MSKSRDDIDKIASLIRTHFDLGGTQINMNIVDKQEILEAHKDPTKSPDLVVRVTAFSAFFASLSPEMRQIVVDRFQRDLMADLEYLISWINMVIKSEPMLGLFGTVLA